MPRIKGTVITKGTSSYNKISFLLLLLSVDRDSTLYLSDHRSTMCPSHFPPAGKLPCLARDRQTNVLLLNPQYFRRLYVVRLRLFVPRGVQSLRRSPTRVQYSKWSFSLYFFGIALSHYFSQPRMQKGMSNEVKMVQYKIASALQLCLYILLLSSDCALSRGWQALALTETV
jgi:hypothetical protein